MILSFDQIKEIIIANPHKDLVKAGCDYSDKVRKHMYGHKLSQSINQVEGYENKRLYDLRVKYAQSNKDLSARLFRPIDKVFSAKGGSVYYNLPDAAEKRARQLSSDVKNGYNIKQWLNNFWRPHYIDDPCGFLFMEIMPAVEVMQMRQKGKSYVYPTYKSISTVYDYLPAGEKLEYVVFSLSANEKKKYGIDEKIIAYRVVDDAKDYLVKREGEKVYVHDEIPNFFMQVPAILNSDIPNPEMEGNMLSIYDTVLEIAENFFLKGSIKLTHDFMHGFPKYWEYADSCNDCGGEGLVEAEKCKTCKGTGKSIMTKVSDAKLLTHPQSKDDPSVAPNVAGYVSPDKTFWEISTNDLGMLEDVMHYTIWGVSQSPKTQGLSTDGQSSGKTATQIVSEIQPQVDRLHPITEAAERRHKFILDSLVLIQISQAYQGSTVNYGKRYGFEGPDVIWEKYSSARTKGAASSVLDDLLLEYLESKYDSDPVKLAVMTRLTKVEPFIHKTPEQVKALGVDELDYKAKLYFSEWIKTKNDAEILVTDAAALKAELQVFVSVKQLPAPEPKPIAA